MNKETRPLTELEQLQGLLNNLIEYQERIVRETNAEIEETKEKIKVLKIGEENGCRN